MPISSPNFADWFRAGLNEVRAGLSCRDVWIALANEDIGDQHRKSILGPLWLLLNYLAFAGAFVLIFHRNSGVDNFGAYVAVGLFVWQNLSDVVTRSVRLFVGEQSFIKGTTLPLSVYAFRLTMQTLIRASYSGLGCIGLLLFLGVSPNPGWLLACLGLLIIVLTIPAVAIVLATMGAFLPDVEFIVSNLMRLGIFVTPIFWYPAGNDSVRALLYHYNPFTYFLEIVRIPILGSGPVIHAFTITTTIMVLAWILAIFMIGRFRRAIVFVV